MKASEIMTRRVISVSADAPIGEAARLMLENGISGVLVMDAKSELVGILTEGDFLRRAETRTERHRARWIEFLLGPGRLAADYVRTHGRKVEEIMTHDVATVDEGTLLADVVSLMERRHIKRVPVMRGVRVVGVISRANLMQALASLDREAAPSPTSDTAIREALIAEMNRHPWSAHGFINPVVRNGVVELRGTIFDERERGAIRVAAENIAGVKEVRDHLAWMEPISGIVIEAPETWDRDTRSTAH
jgi:CBS domain-containing protein